MRFARWDPSRTHYEPIPGSISLPTNGISINGEHSTNAGVLQGVLSSGGTIIQDQGARAASNPILMHARIETFRSSCLLSRQAATSRQGNAC